MKRSNKILIIGIFIIMIITSLRYLSIQLPEYILGFGYGIGIAFELIDAY